MSLQEEAVESMISTFMAARAPPTKAVEVLHYALPAAVSMYYLVTAILVTLFLRKPKAKPTKDNVRLVAIFLIPAIGLTNAADCIVYICRALIQKGWWASQDEIVYSMGSILVWAALFVAILASKTLRLSQHTGAWLIASACEVSIFIITFLSKDMKSSFDTAELFIHLSRIIFLLAIYGYTTSTLIRQKFADLAGSHEHTSTNDEERQPLIGAPEQSSEELSTGAENGYGAIDKSSAESESDAHSETETERMERERKKVEEEQMKRVEEAGGWWGYIKLYKIFLPHLWPSENQRMQFFLFIIGLTILAGRAFHVLVPRQLGIVVDALTASSGTGVLPWKEIITLFVMDALSDTILYTVKESASYRFSMWSWQRLNSLAFGHVINLSMDFHDSKDSAEVIKAVEQANSLNRIVRLVLFDAGPIILDLVIGVGYITSLFDVYFAFLFIFTAIPFFLVSYLGTKWSRSFRRINQDRYRFLSRVQFQSISNWSLVTYFNRASHEEQRLSKAVVETAKSAVEYQDMSLAISAAQELTLYISEMAMMLLAAYRVSQGVRPIGAFVTIRAFWSRLTYPIWTLARFSRDFSNLLVDAERMLQLLHTKSSVTDKEGARDIRIAKGHIQFKDVEFYYDKRKGTVKDINFEVQGGKTVALVGETGSGKSTLLKLLFRFYDVTGGSIEIDGQDIRDVRLISLREALGNVPQAGSLFNDTILENVRYARLNATEEEVMEACRAACIHEKIMTFPDGYRTTVGERGVKLSGGELQRISIARVVLKNPQIVLLDEATSAVDSATECLIQGAFAQLTKGRTTFVIAHRLSTIMDADMILVLDKGAIVERGTHEELLAKNGAYKKLWETQTKKATKKKEEATALLDI